MTDQLSLKERVLDLTLGGRVNPLTPSDREIIQSPIEIGADEIVSYTLTVPISWSVGALSLPVIRTRRNFPFVAAILGRTIKFTIDAKTYFEAGQDYRLDIKFETLTGDELVAWGIWQCKE
jgi:hypothetical protein